MKKEQGTIYFDGGSRGNPGIGGSGAVLLVGGIEVDYISVSFGLDPMTCNQTEYEGLIAGLELAISHGLSDVAVFGDSKLVVSQVSGVWKCKNTTLQKLLAEVQTLIPKFKTFSISHVYRSVNKRADELANIAMDDKSV